MDLLTHLNPPQRQAVANPHGPALVLAGPGSGKTRVLTHRIIYLVSQDVSSRRILAVTFTNKAAREMRRRVEVQLPGAMHGITIGTFHSVCARILRVEANHLAITRDFVIYDRGDQMALIKEAMDDLGVDERQFRAQRIHAEISNAKNELVRPFDYQMDTYLREIAGRVYERYQVLLYKNNAVDFDDLLLGAVELFRDHPDVLDRYRRGYEHVLVDEFQDTNMAQYELLLQITSRHRRLYVVADPDQSIYRWRGADRRNVLRFQDEYPDAPIYQLEQNYRSTQVILDAATAVINRNTGRKPKALFTDRKDGASLRLHQAYDRDDEAQYVVDTIALATHQGEYKPGDCAIMYRTNAQSRALEESFIRSGLPYRLVGGTRFYLRREIRDVLAFLRVVCNPLDSVSLFRIINVPARGIGTKTTDLLRARSSEASVGPADILSSLSESGVDSPHYQAMGARSGKPLTVFARKLSHWLSEKDHLSVSSLIDLILESSGYAKYIQDGGDQGEERWNNVMELRNVASDTDSTNLSDFLEEAALVSEVDNLSDAEDLGSAPTLLTLHASKGLEFPVVFIVGLEEGVLPHKRSSHDTEEMEEERRLFYVGLTRAKDRVFLTYSLLGKQFLGGEDGGGFGTRPSSFLYDIPDHLITGDVLSPKQSVQRGQPASLASHRDLTWVSASENMRIPPQQFDSGQSVQHAEFGEGIVVESEAVGGDEIVTVNFVGIGVKRLLADMANLKRASKASG